MSTPPTPTTVEPGQVWRDNDQRTKHPEFTVLAVWKPDGLTTGDVNYLDDMGHALRGKVHSAVARGSSSPGSVRNLAFAVVRREDGRLYRIRTDRILKHTGRKTGYTYLGMSK